MYHAPLHKDCADVPELLWPRRAWRNDETRIFDHLKRLSAEDRSMRFCGAVSDPTLRRQAGNVANGYPVGLLALAPGEGWPVRAMIEVAQVGDWAEVALSVEPEWRGMGVAPMLLRAAADHCIARGIKRMEAMTLPENRRMRGLGRKFHAKGRPCDGAIRLDFDPWALRAEIPGNFGQVAAFAPFATATRTPPEDMMAAAAAFVPGWMRPADMTPVAA